MRRVSRPGLRRTWGFSGSRAGARTLSGMHAAHTAGLATNGPGSSEPARLKGAGGAHGCSVCVCVGVPGALPTLQETGLFERPRLR